MSSTATVPPPAAEERWTDEHLPDVPLGATGWSCSTGGRW